MLAAHFSAIRAAHVACVALSGGLFSIRALLRIGGGGHAADHWMLRLASYVIDTTLLGAAVLLTLILRQYPFVDAWLTAKVLLLPVYIAFGSFALKRARSRRGQIAATFGAWLTFASIIGIAVTQNPGGWLSLMAR